MERQPVQLGETFHKSDYPLIVWTVDRFNQTTEHQHVELTRMGDPMTRITVSVDALTDRRYFIRSVAEPR